MSRDGLGWSMSLTEESLMLDVVAVPEPATLALLGLGTLAIPRRRRV